MNRFISLTLVLLLMVVAVTGMAEQNRDLIPTDYSNPENWYRVPEITRDVDTIFIYPTVYINAEENASEYAPLGDPMIIERVENMTRLQACVFEESTNLFMPFYRQANLTIEAQTYFENGDIQSCLENLYDLGGISVIFQICDVSLQRRCGPFVIVLVEGFPGHRLPL